MFMGVKVYNELPLELRKIKNNEEFEKKLKEYFQWHLKICPETLNVLR